MKRFVSLVTLGLLISLFAACIPTTTVTLPPPTATTQPELPQTAAVPVISHEPAAFPLSEMGPHHVGTRKYSFNDTNRDGRFVGITIWYPAIKRAESRINSPTFEATPDGSLAPYPLILSSTKVAELYAPYLVRYGFVWVSVNGIDAYSKMAEQMYEQPLDILFALDQVASNPPEELSGMINTEQVGVIGYSFDGYNTLALSGARINPEYYLSQCPKPDLITEPLVRSVYSAFDCDPAQDWDQFTANAGEDITASNDGLWLPITDDRIRAVMPMAGEGWWLFGERGLAAVNLPVLMIVGTEDGLYQENVLIYEHLGTPDKAMISFVGDGHIVMVTSSEHIARVAHFATAFFGYHLQGHEDYAWYFSEDFVTLHNNLAWGVYGK